jgi:hypothetical protein
MSPEERKALLDSHEAVHGKPSSAGSDTPSRRHRGFLTPSTDRLTPAQCAAIANEYLATNPPATAFPMRRIPDDRGGRQ